MYVEKRILKPFAPGVTDDFERADLEIYSIDHLRPTFECLIYFNKKKVNEKNPNLSKKTFAGTFTVFGHTDCWGGNGHCQSAEQHRRFDRRPSHPMTRAFKRVVVTRALRHALNKDAEQLVITLVTRTREEWKPAAGTRLLDFSGLQLVTFV